MSSNHRRSSSSDYHDAVLHNPQLDETQEEEPPEPIPTSTAEIPSARARGENVQVTLTNVTGPAETAPEPAGSSVHVCCDILTSYSRQIVLSSTGEVLEKKWRAAFFFEFCPT